MDLLPETLPEIIKVTSTGISITKSGIWIIDYFARHEPVHVKERLGRSLELMSKRMREEDQRGTWRNDWFAENEVSNNLIPHRLLEKTIKGIINDSAERKSEYIAKFLLNICRTSNSDIDEGTAFSYFEVIESLSWRQLCIIRIVMLCENQEVDTRHIRNEDVEQMPQDEQTSVYSISREFEKLKDNRYIMSSEFGRSEENYEPLLPGPDYGWLPQSTIQLHSLMNLDEIPFEDIIETFSSWNVTRKKAE